MKDVYVGKIVSTHGIKGEVKILSDFEYKDKVFKVGNIEAGIGQIFTTDYSSLKIDIENFRDLY